MKKITVLAIVLSFILVGFAYSEELTPAQKEERQALTDALTAINMLVPAQMVITNETLQSVMDLMKGAFEAAGYKNKDVVVIENLANPGYVTIDLYINTKTFGEKCRYVVSGTYLYEHAQEKPADIENAI